MKSKFYISTIFSFVCLFSNGQLITIPGPPPGSLVQNVLLGSGVTVSNIMYNGSPGAISEFTATGTNLGIANGIVITTGTVSNTGSGPQGPNNQTNSGIDNSFGGSGLLSNIIGGTQTFNAAVLEFDFVPYSDTVRFKYVFGSEEYPEFAPPNNVSYNDVFGFFISGPGILGNPNIAKLPNGAIVSINNVNPITNPSFYNANGDGNSSPQNGSPYYIQYDGFTDVLEAVSRVQCGQTYHLIIAVADVGDGIFDSGIFLEANSLSSKTPVDITYTLSQQVFADPNLMAEGCVSATVTLTRGTNDLASPMTIPINVGGTATEGVDYTNIPNSITFPAGQTTVSFTLNALADLLTEGQETVILNFPITDPCGNVTPIVINLGISDVQPVTVTVADVSVLCPGNNVTLTAVPSGGVPPYTYSWDTGATTPSISVAPLTNQTYTVSVTDNCLNATATDSGIVTVAVYDPIVITVTPDITEICPYIPALLDVVVTGGAGGNTYSWSSSQGQQLGNLTTQSVTPSTTTTYSVLVTDQCGNQQTADILYTITSPPLLITLSPNVEICPGDSVQIGVSATGGYGQYYYLWPQTGASTPTIWVHPTESTSYQVSVSDECQTFTVTGNTNVYVVHPIANFEISSNTLFDDLPITFQNTTVNGDTYQWFFGDGNTSTVVHPNNTYDDPGTYLITLIATDEKGCTDTISKPISIEEAFYVYVPNTFTPDGLRFNNVFKASTVGVKSLQVRIYNRWGELIFTSDEMDFEWDGTYKGVLMQDGTYSWKISYVTRSGREEKLVGHVNIIR